LKFKVNVYQYKEGQYQQVDLLKLKRKMKPGEQLSINVFIGEQKMPTRLIVERVPVQIANEKRRKLKTDKQNKRKGLTKQRLEFCDVNVHITNTTQEQLPDKQVREFYGLRWQIEIIFKAWKSGYHIDKIKKIKIERFECMNYGTLILIILTTSLLAFCKYILYAMHKEEISELKTFKTIKGLLRELKIALQHPEDDIGDFLEMLLTFVHKTGVKQQKRGRKSPYSIFYQNP
jgi:hypothetical protein